MTRSTAPTGAGWCREVPSDWGFAPLRQLGAVVSGGTPSSDEENWNGDIPFVTPPDLRPVVGASVSKTERTVTRAAAESGSSLVPANTVLVSIRAPIGYVARTTMEAAFNQGCRALVPKSGVSSKYLTYALVAAGPELESLGRGSTFMELSAAQFSAIRVPVPSLDEQRDIANYLDRETARINMLIEEQQRLIEMLRERRAAISDRHFYIRSGKRETTLRRVLRPLARPAVPGLGVITAYRDGAVTLRSKRRDEGYTFSDNEQGYQEVREGDLVFHALDGFAGAVGISDSHGNATPVYHVCEAIGDDDPTYLAMLLRYLGLSGYLSTQAPNVRQRSVDFRNWTTFARIPVALPEPETQRAAVAEITEQTAKIDTLIADTETIIELARERRSALITAAVTGQIDVRGAA